MHHRLLALFLVLGTVPVSAQEARVSAAQAPPTASKPSPECASCAAGAQCVTGACRASCEDDWECPDGRLDSAGPARERWELHGNGPAPDGFHVAKTPLWSAFTAGAMAFSVGYLSAVVSAIAVGGLRSRPTYLIPVAGPILGFRPAPRSSGFVDFSDIEDAIMIAAIALNVSIQVSGIATMIGGLASRKRWLVRDSPGPRVTVVPGAGGSPLGASVVGSF